MKPLSKCPYHDTELIISGEFLLTCDKLVIKNKKQWKCQYLRYSASELPYESKNSNDGKWELD